MKTKLWYAVHSGGDGSVSVAFFTTEALAELSEELEILRFGESWGEPSVYYQEIEHEGEISFPRLQTIEDLIKEFQTDLNDAVEGDYYTEGDKDELCLQRCLEFAGLPPWKK